MINGERANGKALLETDALTFRGDRRVTIAFEDITGVTAEEGRLTIEHVRGTAIFELGNDAERWADRIRHPKTVVDKLGVRAGQKVVVVNLAHSALVGQLAATGARVTTRASGVADVIFLGANHASDLARLHRLKNRLKQNGSLWVVRPKGHTLITERDVLSAGKEAGLVDVKVVRLSDTHTAEKFVIPAAARRR
jgi:hypothetical protein